MAGSELADFDREPDVLRIELSFPVDAIRVSDDGGMENVAVEEKHTVEIAGDKLAKFNECGYVDVDVLSGDLMVRVRVTKEVVAADVGEKRQLEGRLGTRETFNWLDAIDAPSRPQLETPTRLRSTRARAPRRNVRTGRAKARAPGSSSEDDPDPDDVTARLPVGGVGV